MTLLDQTLNKIKLDPEVLKLDANQPEFSKPIWDYVDRATSKQRVLKGRRLLEKHKQLLNRIEKRYKIPKEIIIAIWAMESDFGANYGNKNVIRSLATLAYHGKRSTFAEQELIAALKIIQNKYANPNELIGSWAGAIGQAQFMPSSYLKYAVDFDKNGKRNLWTSQPDVFASIAHYLSKFGWLTESSWGLEVKLPENFDWSLNNQDSHLSLSEWKQAGVKPPQSKTGNSGQIDQNSTLPKSSIKAHLFLPAGRYGPVFLLTHNFEVIRRYNKSESYALAVAQLARLLADGDPIFADWPRKDKPLALHKKKDLQLLLNMAGFDSGKIDGKIGKNTRRAIHRWQLEQSLPGDGYATPDLLDKLRNQIPVCTQFQWDIKAAP